MEKIPLQVVALSNSESSPGHFVVVLEDAASGRRLPLIIGAFEAQAIAITMERLKPPRPLTHDLFAATLEELGVKVAAVHIHSVVNNAFVSALVLTRPDGTELAMDARTSDALALAVRTFAPVTVASDVFDEHSIGDIERQSLLRGSVWQYSLAELEIILADLLAKEDYESAAKVRDVMRRKADQ